MGSVSCLTHLKSGDFCLRPRELERLRPYIVKPFSSTELVARVRAALCRRTDPDPFVLGELAVDYDKRLVSVAGSPVELTPTVCHGREKSPVFTLYSLVGCTIHTYLTLNSVSF